MAAQLADAKVALGANDPWVSQALANRTPAEAAKAIIAASAVPDSAKRAALVAIPSGIGSSSDPVIALMRAALPRLQQVYQQYSQLTSQEQVRTGKLARALFDVYGTTIPPDATFTLRIADGMVQGYS